MNFVDRIFRKRWQLLVGVFALRLVLFLSDPKMAWGLSPGLGWLISILILLAISVVIGGLVAEPLVALVMEKWRQGSFVILAFLLSAATSILVTESMNELFSTKEALYNRQTEYFCLTRFQREKCVIMVNGCTDCMTRIDRWKRDLMVENLNAAKAKAQLDKTRSP
jgi:hypothetical protein